MRNMNKFIFDPVYCRRIPSVREVLRLNSLYYYPVLDKLDKFTRCRCKANRASKENHHNRINTMRHRVIMTYKRYKYHAYLHKVEKLDRFWHMHFLGF